MIFFKQTSALALLLGFLAVCQLQGRSTKEGYWLKAPDDSEIRLTDTFYFLEFSIDLSPVDGAVLGKAKEIAKAMADSAVKKAADTPDGKLL